jgi:RNA-directed DNA polymerase
MSLQLSRIAAKARTEPQLRFTALARIITPEFLEETWRMMNRRGASGIDGETTRVCSSQPH